LNAGTKLGTLLLLLPSTLGAQGFLEQFSYEGLRLTGMGADAGVVVSDALTTEPTGGIRVDLGWFAPKIRLVAGGSYFRGAYRADEIDRFERQIEAVTGVGGTIDLGVITLTSWQAFLDLHYMPAPQAVVRPYGGLGLGVHIRNGDGAAINQTFVEDALDTIAAGLAAVLGVEVRVTRGLWWTVESRGNLTSELLSASFRSGVLVAFPRRTP
jgi:hypothetical protein